MRSYFIYSYYLSLVDVSLRSPPAFKMSHKAVYRTHITLASNYDCARTNYENKFLARYFIRHSKKRDATNCPRVAYTLDGDLSVKTDALSTE